MKKSNQGSKKRKSPKKKKLASKKRQVTPSTSELQQESPVKQKPTKNIAKRVPERKEAEGRSITKYVSNAGQFLREARVELKKVKWPTRKELLASTAVVIVLVLVVSFYLGVVDFGLIKIIKNIVG
jgi:preprotein translocase subunit SecE